MLGPYKPPLNHLRVQMLHFKCFICFCDWGRRILAKKPHCDEIKLRGEIIIVSGILNPIVLSGGLQIRLVGGNSSNEGRLEILHDDVWSTVCSDFWSTHEAKVACLQLGLLHENAEVLRNMEFGKGPRQIWPFVLACFGWESSLDECGLSGWGTHNCAGHGNVAGIRCKRGLNHAYKINLMLGMLFALHTT